MVLENWNFLVNGEAGASNLDDNPGNEGDFEEDTQASTFGHNKKGASILGVSSTQGALLFCTIEKSHMC